MVLLRWARVPVVFAVLALKVVLAAIMVPGVWRELFCCPMKLFLRPELPPILSKETS